MKGHVLAGKLLIKQDSAEEKTESGIFIPTAIVEPPLSGKVVVRGEARSFNPTDIKVGDHVLFADHAGTPVVINEPDLDLKGEFILLDQNNVLFYTKK